jgi:hypothetical protein
MVDYPKYMSAVHQYWLDGVTTWDSLTISTGGGMVAAINTAIAANPFGSITGYDPTTDLAAMVTAISAFQTINTALNYHTDYDAMSTAAAAQIDAIYNPSSYITARALAHATALDNDLDTKVYPRFEAGMRDINAVMTSAFVIGRAIIEIDRNDKYDKFLADMEFQADSKRADLIQNATGEMIRMFLQKTEFSRVIAAMLVDEKRLAIAAQQDYKTEGKAIAGDRYRWPLECYKYGSNMLAGISGGTTGSVPVDGNKTARIIGSGLSGASAGAMIGSAIGGDSGSGWGAAIGGIAGLIAGAN